MSSCPRVAWIRSTTPPRAYNFLIKKSLVCCEQARDAEERERQRLREAEERERQRRREAEERELLRRREAEAAHVRG